MAVNTKTYEDLPKRKQAYVDAYLQSGDKVKAYLEAGYQPSRKSMAANAYHMYRELEGIIRQQIDLRIGQGAVMALKIIRELMEDEKQTGTVRLQAAKDYLSRAGYDKPVESTLTIDDLREVDNEDLNDELQTLLAKAVGSVGPKP